MTTTLCARPSLSSAVPRAEVDRRREQEEAQAPALMVICHMVSELPRPVLQSELEGLVTVVIQVSAWGVGG
jgi:hypothetical protein